MKREKRSTKEEKFVSAVLTVYVILCPPPLSSWNLLCRRLTEVCTVWWDVTGMWSSKCVCVCVRVCVLVCVCVGLYE